MSEKNEVVKSRDDVVGAVVVVVYYRHLPPMVVVTAALWRGNENISEGNKYRHQE